MSKLTDKWRKDSEVDIPAPTQFSLRPTVRMTAQIHALMKLFPGQNKTDLINDLLRAGLSLAIEEITGDQEYFKRQGVGRENIEDYEDEEARKFVTYYREELDSALAQVEEIKKKKGGNKGK